MRVELRVGQDSIVDRTVMASVKIDIVSTFVFVNLPYIFTVV